MQMSGHEAETVVLADLSVLATYVEAGAHGVCMPTPPLSGEFCPVSTGLYLVPCMESCKLFNLIDEIVQPFPVLTLEGVQFG